MDETSLRALLELAVSAEPPAARPLGRVIAESRKTGRRLRWRRRVEGGAACVAGIAVIAAASMFAAGHAHRPSAADTYDGSPGMAYVLTQNGDVVPVDLATFRAGRPVKTGQSFSYENDVIAARGDRTLYISTGDGVITTISTKTRTIGRHIRVAGSPGRVDPLVGTPNGTLGYAVDGRDSQTAPDGITPIDLMTGTALRKLSLPPGLLPYPKAAYTAVSSNSKALMVVGFPGGTASYSIEVSLIDVASQQARKPITFSPGNESGPCVAMSPDGATAYVAYPKSWSKGNTSLVIVPIDVATDRPLKPIKLPKDNDVCTMAVAPNGQTAYVLTGRYVTPVNLARGTADKPIELPDQCYRAHTLVRAPGKHRFVVHIPALCDSITNLVIDPDGTMAYAIGTDGVTPVDLATGTALPAIKLAAQFVSFTPNGKTALVGIGSATKDSGELLSIQAATGKVGRAVRMPGFPAGILVSPSVGVAQLYG